MPAVKAKDTRLVETRESKRLSCVEREREATFKDSVRVCELEGPSEMMVARISRRESAMGLVHFAGILQSAVRVDADLFVFHVHLAI
jgi:hypothetical protein